MELFYKAARPGMPVEAMWDVISGVGAVKLCEGGVDK